MRVSRLFRLTNLIFTLLFRRLVYQDPINCRIAEVIALLEQNFWHFAKLVQLTNSFLVFCRDLIAFLVVKIEGGCKSRHFGVFGGFGG